MTALERIRRRGRALASFMMPLLAVVSVNASAACVGMTADGATAGFAKAVETHIGDAPHGLGHPSHDLEVAHGADSSHGHEDSQGPGHSHGHDDSHGPAESHRLDRSHGPDHSHGHRSAAESVPLHAGLHHGHGDCPHCPSSPVGEIDSEHAVCSVAEGAVAAAASAPAVQWDQKPFLSPIAWIAPPAAAPPTRISDASSQTAAVPDARSLHVRFCVLLL